MRVKSASIYRMRAQPGTDFEVHTTNVRSRNADVTLLKRKLDW